MSRRQSHLLIASRCSSTTACGVARRWRGGSSAAVVWAATCAPQATPVSVTHTSNDLVTSMLRPLCRKLDVLEELVGVQTRGRREEADHLHLFGSRVLQHMDLSLREQDSRPGCNGLDDPIDQYASGPGHDVDRLFAVRMAVRRPDGLTWPDANHAHRAVLGTDQLAVDQ